VHVYLIDKMQPISEANMAVCKKRKKRKEKKKHYYGSSGINIFQLSPVVLVGKSHEGGSEKG
jgi:hypothetical protein